MANERTRHQIKGLIFKHRRSVLEETNEENTLLANIFKKKQNIHVAWFTFESAINS